MSSMVMFYEMSYDECQLYDGGAVDHRKIADGTLKVVESIAIGFGGQLYSGSQLFEEGVMDIVDGFSSKSASTPHSGGGRRFKKIRKQDMHLN